jgi:hypothetical protein
MQESNGDLTPLDPFTITIPNDPLANLTIPFDFKVKSKKKRYTLQQHSFQMQ